MREVFGFIPDQVTYVCQKPETLNLKWDDIAPSIVTEREVIPCFPVNAASRTSLETARRWADTNRRSYKEEESVPPYREETRDNKPFGISICSYELRERGGMAWKVVDDEGYYFDLRNDVLLDALLNGESKMGRLDAEFIWGVVGSQMKLVRVGSALHEALLASGERKATANISAKNMVPGTVYLTRKKERILYLGMVNTISCELVSAGPRSSVSSAIPESKTLEKHLLLLVIPAWSYSDSGRLKTSRQLLDYLLNAPKNDLHRVWHFKVQKSVATIEEFEKIELPSDLLAQIRNVAIRNIQNEVAKCNKTFAEQRVKYPGDDYKFATANWAHSYLCNLVPASERPQITPEFQPHYDAVMKRSSEKA